MAQYFRYELAAILLLDEHNELSIRGIGGTQAKIFTESLGGEGFVVLEGVTGHVSHKSAFFGTCLASTLTALGVDTVLIAGLSTSGCIRASAVDACQHGFVPLVVREAVGDRHSAPHEASLFDLQAKYAEVVTLDQARGYLAGLRGR